MALNPPNNPDPPRDPFTDAKPLPAMAAAEPDALAPGAATTDEPVTGPMPVFSDPDADKRPYYDRFPDKLIKPEIKPAIEPEPVTDGNHFDKFDHARDAGEPGLAERFRINNTYAYYRNTARGASTLLLLAEIRQKIDHGAKPEDLLAEYAPAVVDARPDQQGHRRAALEWLKNAGATYDDAIADIARYEHLAPWGSTDDSWYAAGEAAAALSGQLVGSSRSPEAFLGAGARGATLTIRTIKSAVANGGIMAAVDPVVQALSIRAGTQEHFDWWGPARSFVVGGIIGGGLHWGGEIVGNVWLKNKRLDMAKDDPQFRRADDKPEPLLHPDQPLPGATQTTAAGAVGYEGPDLTPHPAPRPAERLSPEVQPREEPPKVAEPIDLNTETNVVKILEAGGYKPEQIEAMDMEQARGAVAKVLTDFHAKQIADKESIANAAIMYEGKIYQGASHGNAVVAAEDALGKKIDIDRTPQSDLTGFITTKGRYVSRDEAAEIAKASGQVPYPMGGKLVSEDLWGRYAPMDGLIGELAPKMPPHRVATAGGESIDVQPVVVEADSLLTSDKAGFDQGMQPRDRDRAASQAQVRDIKANLDPERLGYSSEADRGAPIVGPDAMVESGNGRIMAIREAYAENGEAAQRYRDWLAAQGVDLTKYKNPVLVRQRITKFTPEQRQGFAIAANQGSTLTFSATERAMADASRVSPEMLDLIRVPGDLGAAGNRDFVRAFVGKLPATEHGAMIGPDGGLSADGLRRVRSAVIARAYGDANIIGRLVESTHDDVKSISNALLEAAPDWAKLRSDIAAGRVRADIDLTPELLEAVQRTADLRAKGTKLSEFLAQQDAFDKVSAPVEAWMRLFYDAKGNRAAGAQRIAEALKFYAEEARKVSAEAGLDLGLAPVHATDIQAGALRGAGSSAAAINLQAADIAGGIEKSKARAMIYQADAKEELARSRGLPPDTYFNIPYEEWRKVWSEANAAQADLLGGGQKGDGGDNAAGSNVIPGPGTREGGRGVGEPGAAKPKRKRTPRERVAALIGRRDEAIGQMNDEEFFHSGQPIEGPGVDIRTITNPVSGTPAEKLAQTIKLTEENKPILDEFARAMDERFGVKTETNVKKPERILEKAARPSVLKKKPWHGVEHLRDTLRFRTTVESYKQLPDIINYLERSGLFEVVRRDVDMASFPKEWGFRAAVFDVRMRNGQILEYYVPVREIKEVMDTQHKIYEEWRNKDQAKFTEQDRVDYAAAVNKARATFQKQWDAYLARTGESESAVRASLQRALTPALSAIREKSLSGPVNSSMENVSGRQTPSLRIAEKPGAVTAIEPSRDVNAHSGAATALATESGIPPNMAEAASKLKPDPRQGDMLGLSPTWQRDLAQKRANERLMATKEQKPLDFGLFGDESRQADLVDMARSAGRGDEQASIAMRRGGGIYPNEQTRPGGGVASPATPLATVPQTPQQAAAIQSLQQQVMSLAEALDFPVRQGRIQTRGAQGVFKQGSGVVRVKEIADFEVVAHEAGHAIEAKAGVDLTNLTRAFSSELVPLVNNPGAYPVSQHVKEGFAEYTRRYIGNPAWAQMQAPGFTMAFRQFMEQRHPQVMKALDDASAGYRAYLDAPSVDAIHAVVRSKKENLGWWRSLVEQRRDEGFPAVVRSVMSKGYDVFFDDKADWTRATRALVAAIREKEGAAIELKAADNPEKLARLAVRPQQAALQDSQYGVRPYHETTPRGPSLEEAISTAAGEPTAFGKWDQQKVSLFDDYLVARMGADRWDEFYRGEIPNPPAAFSKVDAIRAMTDIEAALPQVRDASNMVHAWTRELLTKAYDAGFIDKALYDKLLSKPFYVPLMRDLSDRPLSGGGMAKGRGSGDQAPQIIKAFRGSSRDIISPIESLMAQSYMVNRAIQENDVKLALLRLSERAGIEGGRFAEPIPANEMKKYSFDLGSAIERTAIEKGLNPIDARVMASAVTNTMGGDPIVGTFFRAEPAKGRGEPIVFYKEGGETKAMRVISEAEGLKLYELMTAAPEPVTDVWMHLIASAANIKRTGIITNPTFALSNYLRDQVVVGIIRSDYVPIVSGVRGIVSEITGGEAAHLYGYAGGVAGGAAVGAVERAAEAEINALAKKGYLVNRATSFKGVLELASVTEAGTRNSVFAKVFEAKKKQGLSDYEAMIEAASQAQDILDFSRHGSGTNAIRKLLPFLNAHMQGLDKAKRVMFDPVIDKIKGRQNLTADSADFRNAIGAWVKVFGVGGALGVAYAAIAWQHEAYRDAAPYAKGTHFIIPFGNKIITMPKPFELSFGFTLGEYVFAKFAKDDARAAAQFYHAVMASLLPPNPLTDIPLISTTGELLMNKSLFTGRDIVPQEYQRLAAQEQFNDRTSSVSKWLAKSIYDTTGLGVSPMKIDYAIGNEFGTWGRDVMTLSSGLDENAPAQNWEDRVFLRRFIKDPTRSSETTTKYWGFMGQTTGTYNQAVATYDRFNDKFHDAEAKRFLAQLTPNERAFVIMKSAANEDGKPAFKADEKNLHPLQRSYAAVSTLNKLRKELGDNTFRSFETGENVKLDPVARRDLLDSVRELAQMEMRNAFVMMKEPGYIGRPLFDVNGPMDRIRHISPVVADEIATRYATAKVYETKAVASAFPQLQRELLRAGSQADLGEITDKVAESGYEFGGERVKKLQKRRTTIQPSMQ